VEKVVKVEVERVIEVERIVEVESSLNESFVFMFGPNAAQFNDLAEETLRKNEENLARLLALLEENPGVRLLIEGFANPVLGTVAERRTLMILSERRVAFIAGRIIGRGIAAERMLRMGEGGSFLVARQEDRDRWEQNRRVEVRLLTPLEVN
jgi:outer membrane protein OmpA-like peptidoglycan-associated protein